MIIDEEAYLAHHGVKGMRWGVRRAQKINLKRAAKGKAPLKPSQLVGNKATRGAAYVASFILGSAAGSTIGTTVSGGSIAVASLAGNAAGIAGVIATNRILKNVGNKRVSDLTNP